jgi:large subunit ribosomal protein L28
MPRVCKFTGKKTTTGNTYTHRGKAKYLGGVGTKVTGKTKRKFRPNIQTVTAVIDGAPQRIKVSTKAIRQGMLVKPLKRKYAYRPEAEAQDQAQAVEA